MIRSTGAPDASHSSTQSSSFLDQADLIRNEINSLERRPGFITEFQVQSLFRKIFIALVGETNESQFPTMAEIAAIFGYHAADKLKRTQVTGEAQQWHRHFEALQYSLSVLKRAEAARTEALKDDLVDPNVTRKLNKLRIFLIKHKDVSPNAPLVAEIARRISEYHDQLEHRLMILKHNLHDFKEQMLERKEYETAIKEAEMSLETHFESERICNEFLAKMARETKQITQKREDLLFASQNARARNELLLSEIDVLKSRIGGHIGDTLGDLGPTAAQIQEKLQILKQTRANLEDMTRQFQSLDKGVSDQHNALQSTLNELNSLRESHLQDHLKPIEQIMSETHSSPDFSSLFVGNANGTRSLSRHNEDNVEILELEAEKHQLEQMLEDDLNKAQTLTSDVAALSSQYKEWRKKQIQDKAKRDAEERARSQAHTVKLSQSRRIVNELSEKNERLESSLENIKSLQETLRRQFFELLQPASVALQNEFDSLNQMDIEFQTDVMNIQHAANNTISLVETITKAQTEWRPVNEETPLDIGINFEGDVENQLVTMFSERFRASRGVDLLLAGSSIGNSDQVNEA